MNIDIFLPCRSPSRRVKNKNTKKFANKKFGLFEIKINQLILLKQIKNIIVSTNDKKIINYLKFKNFKKVIIDKRPNNLSTSLTSTDKLIKYVSKIAKSEHILWTHVTSPFFDENDYRKAIKLYKNKLKNYDSLMGVSKIQDFIYNLKKPVNFNKSKEKWPRTQTLKKWFIVNNTVFITSRKNYIRLNDRVGIKPNLMEINKIKSFDVDWPEDFKIAETIYKTKF